MDAIGRLSGEIAHNFNNLLTGIIGNLNLAKSHTPPSASKYLTSAKDAAERASILIEQLLEFSRASQTQLKPIQLNDIIEDVYPIIRQAIEQSISIDLQLSSPLHRIRGDTEQLNTVLINMCKNAQDALTEHRKRSSHAFRKHRDLKISIQTKPIFIGQDYCRTHSQGVPGDYVVLSVTDNGRGMDSKTQDRLFEPFFTTKEVGEGSGLGLASVYGIVKRHEGWIDVITQEGEGTIFHIYFPVAQEIQNSPS